MKEDLSYMYEYRDIESDVNILLRNETKVKTLEGMLKDIFKSGEMSKYAKKYEQIENSIKSVYESELTLINKVLRKLDNLLNLALELPTVKLVENTITKVNRYRNTLLIVSDLETWLKEIKINYRLYFFNSLWNFTKSELESKKELRSHLLSEMILKLNKLNNEL